MFSRDDRERGKQEGKEKRRNKKITLQKKKKKRRRKEDEAIRTMPLFESCFSELRVDGRRLYLKGVNWFGFEVSSSGYRNQRALS